MHRKSRIPMSVTISRVRRVVRTRARKASRGREHPHEFDNKKSQVAGTRAANHSETLTHEHGAAPLFPEQFYQNPRNETSICSKLTQDAARGRRTF
eukprot:8562868-Pyramimonas_sp.AAC.1